MPKLEMDYDSVPEKEVPIDQGTHIMRVRDIPVLEAFVDRNGKKQQRLIVQMEVHDPDSPMNGRKIRDSILRSMETKLKRLAMSAGIPTDSEGYDPDDLYDQHVRVVVRHRTWNDDGEERISADVRDYLPSE